MSVSVDGCLEQYKEHFEQTFEGLVTRNFQPRNNYQKEQLKNGVISIIYQAEGDRSDIYNVSIKLMVIYFCYAGLKGTSLGTEKLVLEFTDYFHQRNGEFLPFNVEVNQSYTSSQAEGADGWVIFECSATGLDLGSDCDEPANVNELFLGVEPNVGPGNENKYVKVGEHE